MQTAKYSRTSDTGLNVLDLVPNEIYENIISNLYDASNNNFYDIKGLLNLNCVNKALNNKFLITSIWQPNTQYIGYNPNLSLHKIICEVLIIQTKNCGNTEKVIKLLDSGIVLTDRMSRMIYKHCIFKQNSPVWNVLKAQIDLWRVLRYSSDNTYFIAAVSRYFDKGVSLNCKNELDSTFIGLLAKRNLSLAQVLLSYGKIYQNFVISEQEDKYIQIVMPFVKTEKFETEILRKQIDESKDLILSKIITNNVEKNGLDFNDSIEILAGQELLLESLKENNTNQLIKLLVYGVNFTKKNLQNAKLDCKAVLEVQYNKNKRLLDAETIKEVSEALESGAQINAVDINGWTLLYFSARRGELEMTKMLINRGANVNAVINDGITPLHLSARKGRLEVTKVLINKGANVNTMDSDGWTPLHLAVHKGHLEVVEILINFGANVNSIIDNGWTPLYFALTQDHLEVSKMLINRGASVNAVDDDGITPLHLAVHKGCLEAVKILINFGANVGMDNIINVSDQILKNYLTEQFKIQQSNPLFQNSIDNKEGQDLRFR